MVSSCRSSLSPKLLSTLVSKSIFSSFTITFLSTSVLLISIFFSSLSPEIVFVEAQSKATQSATNEKYMDQFEFYYGANKAPQIRPSELIKHLENWKEDISVFFYAHWCPHCKAFAPYWNEIAKYQEKQEVTNIKYYSFDCEESDIHSELL